MGMCIGRLKKGIKKGNENIVENIFGFVSTINAFYYVGG